MARAYGRDLSVLFAFESTYGTSPGSGYHKVPVVSIDLGAEQGHIPDDRLGQGRDPQAPEQDMLRVSGSAVVPLDVRNIGFWLKLAMGAPTTTGTNPYTHTYTSDPATLPSAAIDVGNSQVPSFRLNKGVMAQGFGLRMQRGGLPQMTLNLVGQNEVLGTTIVEGSPTTLTYKRFGFHQATIKRAGSALANVIAADLNFDNGLEVIETQRADKLIEAIDPGSTSLTGSITTRFADTTLLTDAANLSDIEIIMEWSIDASNKLTFKAHDCYLVRPRITQQGVGGIEVTFSVTGAWNSSEAEMMEAVLINDKASY